jgi:hypothetical protein
MCIVLFAGFDIFLREASLSKTYRNLSGKLIGRFFHNAQPSWSQGWYAPVQKSKIKDESLESRKTLLTVVVCF